MTRIAQSLIGTRGFTAASQEACGTNRPGSETTSPDGTGLATQARNWLMGEGFAFATIVIAVGPPASTAGVY